MQSNSPDLVEELVGYAATMADYLTRLKNQEKSVEQLGKAMIEVSVCSCHDSYWFQFHFLTDEELVF